jgi:D-alanyl-D-alanine carboxypeptidase/D-alanyl-D-alanine-endopeptidase (penicillin-binding protein 4)
MLAIKKGMPGEIKYSTQVLLDYWKSRGLNTSSVFITDGSGLSPQNGLKPSFMTDMLFHLSKDTTLFQSFFKSLPVAGESGTLSRFCKGTVAEKRIFGKSGTLNKAIGYSGYVRSKDGKTLYSFSILVNNFEGKGSAVSKKIETIMISLSDL